jgi:hypothetical protein
VTDKVGRAVSLFRIGVRPDVAKNKRAIEENLWSFPVVPARNRFVSKTLLIVGANFLSACLLRAWRLPYLQAATDSFSDLVNRL